MENVAVFAVGVAIVWLIFWTVRNDTARSIRDQKGLFRMREHTGEERTPRPARRR